MFSFFTEDTAQQLINIKIIHADEAWREELDERTLNWFDSVQFENVGVAFTSDDDWFFKEVFIFKKTEESLADQICDLIYKLPEKHTYCFQGISQTEYERLALIWGMHAYQYARYKEAKREPARLFLPEEVNTTRLYGQLKGIFLARDLINTPTEDLNTPQFAEIIHEVANEQGATYQEIVGEKLLKENYPAIYTVGRASASAPRLCMLSWGEPEHRKLSLVGKGICFDTGGLNLKPGNAMGLMKKDMGGAANALALAYMIMALKLPINLKVYLPLAENSVSGNAMRPGDVIKTRKGLTVEVTNTDAEGRLVLCDALAKACEEQPELLIDFATLTGAARVAVGTEMSAVFARNHTLAQRLVEKGQELDDWIWQLPLYKPYKKLIQSKIADLDNSGASPYAGAITAALFLNEFVDDSINWLHFDMMAYNVSTRAGHPEGGEAQGLRTLLDYIENEFAVYE